MLLLLLPSHAPQIVKRHQAQRLAQIAEQHCAGLDSTHDSLEQPQPLAQVVAVGLQAARKRFSANEGGVREEEQRHEGAQSWTH